MGRAAVGRGGALIARIPDREPAVADALSIASILTSAFLLFAVQPLIARQLLPSYGGSAAVWNTAQVVFQALLLAGYAYAHALGRLNARRQAVVHAAVVAAAALALPPALRLGASPPAGAWPVPFVVLAVVAAVAPAFFALSANSTLTQAWQAARRPGADAYRLYAASNLGSLVALAAYPLVVEPHLGVAAQRWWWSAGFGLYAVWTALGAARLWRGMEGRSEGAGAGAAPSVRGAGTAAGRDDVVDGADHIVGVVDFVDVEADAGLAVVVPASPPTSTLPAPTLRRRLRWAALAGVPVSLSLSTTLALTTEIAATPLFWTVPLAIYLVTYVLAFGWRERIPRRWAAVGARLCVGLALLGAVADLPFIVPLSLATLFAGALLCHLDLAGDRPDPAHLSSFYLWLAIGGLVGGALNSLLAPVVFDGVAEYPITLAAVAWIAAGPFGGRRRWSAVVFAVAATALTALQLAGVGDEGATVRQARSFFGVVRVAEIAGERVLLHGATQHGSQRLDAVGRRTPTRYYHPAGPLGGPVARLGEGARIGVIGLGTGALAALTRPGQHMTFYEIDPLIEDVARHQFTYLGDAPGRIDVGIGDGRLLLMAEPRASFDLIVVDAFSGDVVPVHLLTAEALDGYRAMLRPGGVVVLHLSSRWLDLDRVLAGYANHRPAVSLASAHWRPDAAATAEGASRTLAVALADDRAAIDALAAGAPGLWRAFGRGGSALDDSDGDGWGLGTKAQWWTDDRSDLLGAMK
ncbi:MAG: fused MFS/spermidine synthase [Ardenticatenales bacterium]